MTTDQNLASLQSELATVQAQVEIAEAQVNLQELTKLAELGSVVMMETAWGGRIDPREFLYDDPDFGGRYISPISRRDDREDGKFRPIFETEQDLQYIRGATHVMTTGFDIGLNILANLTNYTISSGFTHEVKPAEGVTGIPKGLVEAAQSVLDAFMDDNDWASDLEAELHHRSREDGEVAIVLRPRGWRTEVQIVEPDNITQPGDGFQLERWLADMGAPLGSRVAGEFVHSWTFGVHTKESDPAHALGYHVVFDGAGSDWDYFPANDVPLAIRLGSGVMELIKRNVPRNVKRGVSDFYPVLSRLERAEKLGVNVETGAAVQAAIAWIRKHAASATGDKITTMRKSSATDDYQKTLLDGTTRTTQRQKMAPGSIVDTNGTDYMHGPMGQSSAPMYLDVIQSALRRAGSRWSMPEYMISSDACFCEDTEILTQRGWIGVDDLKEEDAVGTINPEAHNLEYQVPDKHFCSHRTGHMVHVKSSRFDLLVTPNHDVYLSKHLWQRTEWNKVQASRLTDWPHRIFKCLATAPWESGSTPDSMDIPGLGNVASEIFLRFTGIYIGDGYSAANGTRVAVAGISRSRKLDYYEPILTELGFKLHIDEGGRHHWYIDNRELNAWLRGECGESAETKRLPELVWRLDKRGLDAVWEGLLNSDGHQPNGNHGPCYSTTSTQLADDVQILSLRRGERACLSKNKPGTKGTLPVYKVSISEGKPADIVASTVATVPYDGKVWCVQVPNGLIVSRRNGKVAVSGNSNNNFASILVAGSPFVQARQADQRFYASRFHRIDWKVLRIAYEGGRFKRFGLAWEELESKLEIEVTPPDITIADEYQATQIKEIEHRNRVLSSDTWIKESGRDVEVEKSNLADEPLLFDAFASPPVSPAGGPSAQTPGASPPSRSGVLGGAAAPSNIAATDALNGAQITAAVVVTDAVTAGKTAPVVGIELLTALGIDRERARLMIDESVNQAQKIGSEAGIPDGKTKQNLDLELPDDAESKPSGEFKELSRQQLKRNDRGIDDLTAKVAAGEISDAVAKVKLTMLGVSGANADAFIADAKDGRIDDPELKAIVSESLQPSPRDELVAGVLETMLESADTPEDVRSLIEDARRESGGCC